MIEQETIAAIGQQQRENHWALRQESAKRQAIDLERQRVAKERARRIATLKAELASIPALRRRHSMIAEDATQFEESLLGTVDRLASAYHQRIATDRQQARPIHLLLNSEEAIAFFFKDQIKAGMKNLALFAASRTGNIGEYDSEKYLLELERREQSIQQELDELQVKS